MMRFRLRNIVSEMSLSSANLASDKLDAGRIAATSTWR